jgi:hypothetical protein
MNTKKIILLGALIASQNIFTKEQEKQSNVIETINDMSKKETGVLCFIVAAGATSIGFGLSLGAKLASKLPYLR